MSKVAITKLNLKKGYVLSESKFKVIDDNAELLQNAINSIEAGTGGREIELRKFDNAIQWRYAGQEEGIGWEVLVSLDDLKGSNGKTGSAGMCARAIELRKGESNIEWRTSNEVEPLVDYTTANPNIPVYKEDIVTKLSFINVPKKAVYAQVKTVTLFGINAEGEDVANVNPSITTMPSGVTFPSLGGFDPSKKEYDISKNKEIEGNMSIQTAIDDMLAQFPSSLKVVDINKIQLWVSFLDADKKELCQILVKFLVQKDITRSVNVDWTELVSLSEITGDKGEKGTDGTNGREIELIKADGFIKWRYAGQDEGIGWTKLIALSELQGEKGADAVLPQLDTIATLSTSATNEEIINSFNALITDLKTKGYMA